MSEFFFVFQSSSLESSHHLQSVTVTEYNYTGFALQEGHSISEISCCLCGKAIIFVFHGVQVTEASMSLTNQYSFYCATC